MLWKTAKQLYLLNLRKVAASSEENEYKRYVKDSLRKPPPSLGKAMGVGAGIGAGAALLPALPFLVGKGASEWANRPTRFGWGAVQGLMGAGIGAGVGALIRAIAKDEYLKAGIAHNSLK